MLRARQGHASLRGRWRAMKPGLSHECLWLSSSALLCAKGCAGEEAEADPTAPLTHLSYSTCLGLWGTTWTCTVGRQGVTQPFWRDHTMLMPSLQSARPVHLRLAVFCIDMKSGQETR